MRIEMQKGAKVSGKSGRELWLQALKEGKGNLASGRKPGNPGHKSQLEYWSGNLRKNGAVNEARPVDSFTGLKNVRGQDMAFLSTSHYLRQSAGVERPTPRGDPTVKSSTGTPNYKSPEEYYDEVLELKKQIVSAKDETDTYKSKIRRLEEENQKKEKQLEQLLDPAKNEELRRTLGDRKADAAIVIQSLKQKIFKLEQQVKEKDAAYTKLATDMKSTKLEEMKVQLEVLYTEVLRLRHAPPVEVEYARATAEMAQGQPTVSPKESAAKIDALSKTVKKLNEDKTKLATENKALKEDLQRWMDEREREQQAEGGVKKEHEDMNRRQLLQSLSRMEARLKKMEEEAGGENRPSRPFTSRTGDGPVDVDNKMALDGNLRERLDQLDKRESELLGEIQQQKKTIERLREDRAHYKARFEEKNKDLAALQDRVAQAQRGEGAPAARPRGRKSTENERVGHDTRGGPSQREVESFREKHAAKVIQRGWRQHREDEEEEEATEVIQSALRGYNNRENFLRRRRDNSAPAARSRRPASGLERTSSASSDEGESIAFLQSAVRGYNARQQQLRRLRDGDEENSRSSVLSRPSSTFARKFDDDEQSQGSRSQRRVSSTAPVRSSSARSSAREGRQVDRGGSRSSMSYASSRDYDPDDF